MEQIDFALLTTDEVYGDKKIDAIDKYGKTAKVTDYAYLLNCDSNNGNGDYWVSGDMSAWEEKIYYVRSDGEIEPYKCNYLFNGCRPAFSYFKIKDIINNFEYYNNISENLLRIKYGDYPQQVASPNLQKN